jgi:hypothetical protein
MTDEAKPPNEGQAGASERPRKPAAGGDKPRKPAVKKPAAKRPPAKRPPAKAADPDVAAAAAATPAVATGSAEETPTEIVSADAGVTQIMPDSEPTQVRADAQTTRVMAPSANPAVPPPFTPVPRSVEQSGGGDRRTTLWLVVALAAVAVLAVILVWIFALRDTGEQFAGNWAPVEGDGGGLVITLMDGGFEVAMYDEDLELTGSYPAARDGDVLTFRYTDTQTQLGMVEAQLTYVDESDTLVLRLTAMGSEGAPQEYVRVDALEAAPSPTPTPAATTTVTPTPSPSASPSPSPSGSDTTQLDQQVVDGVVAIQVGVLNWSAANGNLFPAAAEVAQSGAVGQYVTTWPTNPFTGQPMAASPEQGDYTYEQLNGGQSYKLVGHLAGGLTFTVP